MWGRSIIRTKGILHSSDSRLPGVFLSLQIDRWHRKRSKLRRGHSQTYHDDGGGATYLTMPAASLLFVECGDWMWNGPRWHGRDFASHLGRRWCLENGTARRHGGDGLSFVDRECWELCRCDLNVAIPTRAPPGCDLIVVAPTRAPSDCVDCSSTNEGTTCLHSSCRWSLDNGAASVWGRRSVVCRSW